MYPRFGLTLMVTHACNMRCSYCYTGAKLPRSMPERIGRRAIDRALASLERGGTLEAGFFGGEPLLEAGLIARLAEYARLRSAAVGAHVTFTVTTNGTITTPEAWALMMRADMDLAVSFDGLPDVHDRHRRFHDGRGSSAEVLSGMRRLLEAGKSFRAVMVVRPDNVERLAEGIEFMREFGIRRVDLTLDLWARWQPEDALKLELAIGRASRVWSEDLPAFGVSWFEEKAARLCGFGLRATARCGFGNGEIAVAPSGNLYPCERLIGEDRDANPMRLPGRALEGSDFLGVPSAPSVCSEACSACAARPLCNTTCRCSNYVRTGDPARPDRLLCLLNQACIRETASVMGQSRACAAPVTG